MCLSKINLLELVVNSFQYCLLGLNACRLRFASFGIKAHVLKSVFYFVSCYHQKKKKVKKKRKEEMVIIENIVEDSIEVKYEDESTTHNPKSQLIC